MPNLDTLSVTFKASISGSVGKNRTGSDFPALADNPNFNKSCTGNRNVANNLAGGADDLVANVQTIAASGTLNFDLTSMTDILLQSGVSATRIKGVYFCLLSTAQDSVSGTACSSVTIGNAASNPNQLFLGATTHTITLNNGDFVMYGTQQAAGIAVSGTAKIVKILNNDAVNAAAVEVGFLIGTT